MWQGLQSPIQASRRQASILPRLLPSKATNVILGQHAPIFLLFFSIFLLISGLVSSLWFVERNDGLNALYSCSLLFRPFLVVNIRSFINAELVNEFHA